MYDIAKPDSFSKLELWKEAFFAEEGVHPDTHVWVIGNKCDVELEKLGGVRLTQVQDKYPRYPHKHISVKNGQQGLLDLLQEVVNSLPCPRVNKLE